MVLPGIGSHSPRFQSVTPNGIASSFGVSCRVGTSTRSFSTPSTPGASSLTLRAIPLKICQSLRDSQAGSTALDSGWMKGCMSEVLRSFFSYQVAVGRTTSEYSAVVHMRKSSVTSRSSLPSGAWSRHFTSCGLAAPRSPKSLPCRPWRVPSRCLSMYSWPLPDEPSRLDRQMNMLRGKFSGASGSAKAKSSAPDLNCATACCTGSMPLASASRTTFIGLQLSCGADGSQPMRTARRLKSTSEPGYLAGSASGDRISLISSFS